MALRIAPLELKEANDLVKKWHRHHYPAVGHKFSIGVYNNKTGEYVGAAIIGRPVARNTDHRTTLEITRLVTDGTKNACSKLYSASARIAREMGYMKIQTFILEEEPGTSLIASGWKFEWMTTGGTWRRKKYRQNRREDQPMGAKQKWIKELREEKPPRHKIKKAEDRQLTLPQRTW